MRVLSDQPIVALATAPGGTVALVRLAGIGAWDCARTAGLPLPLAWRPQMCAWPLGGGTLPCRVLACPAGRSFTGTELVEILLPGAPDLVALALAALHAAGAVSAQPGAFTRLALTHGRLSLSAATALLALSRAGDALAAQRALAQLRAGVETELAPCRERLLQLRARLEAGLDFADEDDVEAVPVDELAAELADVRALLQRWRRAVHGDVQRPLVCLVGPANAGKSALFNVLCGGRALVSSEAGTTRDWLEGDWVLRGRHLRLLDSPGWLDTAAGCDAEALAAVRSRIAAASLVLACSAPDAPLPALLPAWLQGLPVLVIGCKADLGGGDPRAKVLLSALTGSGLTHLAELVAQELAETADGDAGQQALLAEGTALIDGLIGRNGDEILAEGLRQLDEVLSDLLGRTTSEEILDALFARFCIGK